MSTPFVRSAVTRLGVDLGAELERPGECAVTAFDPVEVERSQACGGRRCGAPRIVRRVLDRHFDLLAGEAGHFGGDDVAIVGFVDVDRRRPAGALCAERRSSRSWSASSSRNGSHGMARGS